VKNISVLIGCEESGAVREAFRSRGVEAWSCDLKDDSSGVENPNHIVGDVLSVLRSRSWDLAILHPPCTFLSSSGLHWNRRVEGRQAKTDAALQFVRDLIDAAPPRYAIENPVGAIGTKIRPADQYVQPYQFGDDASKKTGLWLRGLPKLRPTVFVEPRKIERPGKTPVFRWSNQTDSGQNRLGPSADRATIRSKTYPGIAAAMAEQWIPVLRGSSAAEVTS